jgi:hypothetical protein
VQEALRPGGVTICAGRLAGAGAEDRARWREIGVVYLAVDCSGLMMMIMHDFFIWNKLCMGPGTSLLLIKTNSHITE